jgi:hypothetical protein
MVCRMVWLGAGVRTGKCIHRGQHCETSGDGAALRQGGRAKITICDLEEGASGGLLEVVVPPAIQLRMSTRRP